MSRAWIALGSNLSDPPAQLRAALEHLRNVPGIDLERCSSFYRSAPLGPAGQADYCNAVCSVRTTLPPERLLAALQQIEDDMGRDRSGQRWGARIIDLDLLMHDEIVMDSSTLTLPHPQLHLRSFVLAPLAELDPHQQVPGRGKVSALLGAVGWAGLGSWES